VRAAAVAVTSEVLQNTAFVNVERILNSESAMKSSMSSGAGDEPGVRG
jgi:hypothetical protein